jgi:hypothetical protein
VTPGSPDFTCERCNYSHREEATAGKPAQELFCRRFPPQLVALPMRSAIAGAGVGFAPASGFPTVHPQAWCGEFRVRES